MHDDTTLDHEDPEAGSTWMWGVSGAVITLAFALGVIWVASARFSAKQEATFDAFVSPAGELKAEQEAALQEGTKPIDTAITEWAATAREAQAK